MHESIADYIVDVVQNAIESTAGNIELEIRETDAFLSVLVRDDGRGMTPETLSRARDPFYSDGIKHPERSVGLGIPFLLQLVASVGGEQRIFSEPGNGTEVSFSLPVAHIDMPPIGDICTAVTSVLTFDGAYELTVFRSRNGREYTVRRSELRSVLEELESVGARTLLLEYVRSQEECLHA